MTRGTKVGWGCQNNFLRLKDAVFFQYWGALLARAKAQATVFVPRVKNARATFLSSASGMLGLPFGLGS
jgi:hypothetical protein